MKSELKALLISLLLPIITVGGMTILLVSGVVTLFWPESIMEVFEGISKISLYILVGFVILIAVLRKFFKKHDLKLSNLSIMMAYIALALTIISVNVNVIVWTSAVTLTFVFLYLSIKELFKKA